MGEGEGEDWVQIATSTSFMSGVMSLSGTLRPIGLGLGLGLGLGVGLGVGLGLAQAAP